MRNASITHFHPANKPAAAISFISPPPKASTPFIILPIIRHISINPLTATKPIRCPIHPSGFIPILITASTNMAIFSPKGISYVLQSITEITINIEVTKAISTLSRVMPLTINIITYSNPFKPSTMGY